MRDECLDREIFVGIEELRYVVERWRQDYNHHRPHQSLGYMTPAAFAITAAKTSGALPQSPGIYRMRDQSIIEKKQASRGWPMLRSLRPAPVASRRAVSLPQY